MKKMLLPVLLAVAMFGSANTASAAAFVLDLSTVVTGATPGGTTPYLSLEFEDLGGGVVEVTFNAVNLVLSEFATTWNFNINPTLEADLGDLDIEFVDGSGIEASSYGVQANSFSAAAGSDNYDIQFSFPTGDGAQLGPDGD